MILDGIDRIYKVFRSTDDADFLGAVEWATNKREPRKTRKKEKMVTADFRRFSQIFKRKELLTQGSQKKQKTQKLIACFSQHNHLLNNELHRFNKKNDT